MVETILVVSVIAKRFLSSEDFNGNGFDVIFADEDNYKKFMDRVDFVIAGIEPYDKTLLEDSGVKMISRCGHGTDNIAQGIVPVCDCRGCLDITVAEAVVGYMIMGCRHLLLIDGNCRKGIWDAPRGNILNGRVVGIIGFGGIGKTVARLLKSFDVKLLHNDIIKNRSNCSIEKLVSSSDIITLHCDLNIGSMGLIDDRLIGMMKDGVVFINTSRGRVVNEKHLIKYHKKFGCIILDVFNEEPLNISNGLLGCGNIVFGTHSAGYSFSGHRQMANKSLLNIMEWNGK